VTYEGRHAPCGTVVADELPEGYPVEEGVGLYCPRCRQGFWSLPEPEPEREREPQGEPEPHPDPEPEPLGASGGGHDPSETPRLPVGRRGPRVWPAVGLIGATSVAALAIVLALTAGGEAPAPPAPTMAAPTPVPTATAMATPAVREVTRGSVTATLPPGWRARRDGARVILRGPDDALVTVAPGPRRAKAGRRRAGGREITTIRKGRRSWRITRYLDRGGVRVARSVRIR
jgi:hypothetical protein